MLIMLILWVDGPKLGRGINIINIINIFPVLATFWKPQINIINISRVLGRFSPKKWVKPGKC